MKSLKVLFVLFATLLSTNFASAAIIGTLDQSQTSSNASAHVYSARFVCQTFTPSVSGYLSGISIWLDSTTYAEQAPATIEILQTTGGTPSGSPLWSQSYPTLSQGWFDVPINNGEPYLVLGQTYGLALLSSNTGSLDYSGDAWNMYVPSSGSPSLGSLWENRTGSWGVLQYKGSSIYNASAAFQTYVLPPSLSCVYSGSASEPSWSTTANWTYHKPGVGDTAEFSKSLGTLTAITLDGPQTVSNLTFANSGDIYSITSSGTDNLTLSNGTSSSVVNVSSGTHGISAPITLESDLVVSTSAGTQLTFSGNVSGSNSLTKSGPGELILSGTGSWTGGTFVDEGTVVLTTVTALQDGSSLTIGDASAFLAPIIAPSTLVASSQVEPVPEPGSIFLLLASGTAFLAWRSFRRKQ